MSTVRFCRLLARAPDDPEPVLGRRLAPPARHRHPELAPEIPSGERGRVLAGSSSTVPSAIDLAAEAPRPRPQVDHVVGRLDGVGVVLHHDHRVAQVAQSAQRAEQALVVPLVQPDARLVEDVEHAHQPRADLGGQPDALGLAAGERRRAAAERQVVEPHVPEEAQPVARLP